MNQIALIFRKDKWVRPALPFARKRIPQIIGAARESASRSRGREGHISTKGADKMKKLIIGASVTAFLLVLFVSVFAFSTSLSNLRISAATFAKPSVPVFAAPMTFADESEITVPQADSVRFQQLEQSERVCARKKSQANTAGF